MGPVTKWPCCLILAVLWPGPGRAEEQPVCAADKPAVLTMAQLAGQVTSGVSAPK